VYKAKESKWGGWNPRQAWFEYFCESSALAEWTKIAVVQLSVGLSMDANEYCSCLLVPST